MFDVNVCGSIREILLKMDGKFDQVTGNLKKAAGNAMGNRGLQAEGTAQNTAGQGSEAVGKAGGYAQGLTNQVKGAVSSTMNSLTGNSSGNAEGKATELAGQAQKKWNS
ncbi:uncharacterized protein EV154DRAFT_566080 [Mucor mucedo]|uniref:uncharacterized protein n=1 Tax=Mucor mucedo TaxID=29922 RepID=UPI00221F9F75|nr:uncharacterized protein EV154DRAFT_566080 [Mucor mucedo]KAI7888737.1 hypothetical protein EV154DRAFT_566080 [Mucor mucedo]